MTQYTASLSSRPALTVSGEASTRQAQSGVLGGPDGAAFAGSADTANALPANGTSTDIATNGSARNLLRPVIERSSTERSVNLGLRM